MRNRLASLLIALVATPLLVSCTQVRAEEASMRPLGKADAPQGGTLRFRLNYEPPTLSPLHAEGYDALEIHNHVLETLLTRNPHTYQWEPLLAEKWQITPEGHYEFELRRNAKWSDGRAVTAEDVKFSFDVIFDDRFPTAYMRAWYEGLKKVEVLGKHRVRIIPQNTYFGNFVSAASLFILPKHVYGDPKKGPRIRDTVIGSGPYVVKRWEKGSHVVIQKRKDWWGRDERLFRGKFNADRIFYRVVSNENVAIEMVQKGQLDFIGLSPDMFVKKTSGHAWGKEIFKKRVQNKFPKSTQMIVWNLDRPIFQDRKVRRALAHLVDRPMMIEKFYHGLSVPATGPWYRQSEYADASVKPVPFDPKQALRLLREAGWKDSDRDGILDKIIQGKRHDLSFTILTGSGHSARFLTIFQEDAKRAGVDIQIKFIGWNSLGKLLDERKFDALEMVYDAGGVDVDPHSNWHSSVAGPGGGNFPNYRNKEVDRLIEMARQSPDQEIRRPLLRKIYRIIASDMPCLFLFNDDNTLYAHSARVGMPSDTFDYDLGFQYWWVKK